MSLPDLRELSIALSPDGTDIEGSFDSLAHNIVKLYLESACDEISWNNQHHFFLVVVVFILGICFDLVSQKAMCLAAAFSLNLRPQ